MSDYKNQENAMPVGPLKLAVLESCREFGNAVNKHLVEFRQTSPLSKAQAASFHRDIQRKATFFSAPVPVSEQVKARE